MKIFTHAQVARILKVAPATVDRWADDGKLKSYRIPGTQDRRVTYDSLYRFCEENEIDLTLLAVFSQTKVLLITFDEHILLHAHMVCETLGYETVIPTSLFDAGTKIGSLYHFVIVDFEIGKDAALEIISAYKAKHEYYGPACIAILDEKNAGLSFDRSAVCEAFKKPVNYDLLQDALQSIRERQLRFE